VNILITGADGFIGRCLVSRLLSAGEIPGLGESRRLVLLDRGFASLSPEARVRAVAGDFADSAILREAFAQPVDCIFHLASIPGGAAEADFERGLNVNLEGTLKLLEQARRQSHPAKLVFASTIGVYGAPLPERIDESTVAAPTLSYGAHKLIGEVLVSDYSRRAFIDGRCVRIPGIVARPPQPSGLLSGFLSNLIRTLSAGRPFVCPVAADGMSWWMSRTCVVENLLHAAGLSADEVQRRRVWLLPVLRASMAEIVAAIGRVRGQELRGLVEYRPDAALQAQFASYPPLHCPGSVAAGFRNDGTLEALVQRALD
jgi:nucleoside-diphosphate-sugar epimerase